MKNFEISVVAPVSDSKYLERVIQNINRQSLLPLELVIVLNGEAVNEDTEIVSIACKVPIIVSSNTRGSASDARNIGMNLSNGSYIALMDQDDYWLSGKLSLQKQYMEKLPVNSICATSAFRVSQDSIEIRPKRRLRKIYLSQELYQLSHAIGGVYIPTTSLIFPKDLTLLLTFDSKLGNREDLNFLLDAEQAGFNIYQMPEPLVAIEYSIERAISRETPIDYLQWVVRLWSRSRKLSMYFMFGIGARNLIVWLISRIFHLLKKLEKKSAQLA